MPINFPNSPTTNQLYTYDNKTWQWNGVYWGVYSALTSYITSAYTAGDGYSNISGVTNGNLVLKSFSGVGLTITDTGNKLTFTSTGSYLPTSGGTITGNTIYTSGLTATTISANTLSLPFTTGSVVFQGSGGTLNQNNSQFYWDNVNNRLGICTSSPSTSLTVSGTNELVQIGDGSQANSSYISFNGVRSQVGYKSNGLHLITSSSRNIVFGTGTFASTTEWARFALTTGNLLLGTITDSGFKLDVNGTARIQNQLTTTGSINASAAIARGTYLNQTLVATANNDVLVGLDIQPTFTTGAFTGVAQIGLRVNGSIQSPIIYGATYLALSSGASTQPISFYLNQTSTQIATFFGTTGNLTLQNGGTFTDQGFRLDVNGTTKLRSTVRLGSINQPSAPTLTTNSTTGGTLTAATYFYRIVAVDFFGSTTTPSNELSVTTTGSTSSITLAWAVVSGAYSYRIYRGTTSGGQNLYYTVNGTNTTSFTDTGAAGTAGTTPTENLTAYGSYSTSSGDFRSGNITIVNNGIGNYSSILFDKSTDTPAINVVEYSSDSTMFEFSLRDNPDGGGDFFHWVLPDWQNPSSGWKPLKFANLELQFIGSTSNFWSSFLLPSSTPYYTTNPDSLANSSIKWNPYTSNTYNLIKDSGTGTGNLNVEISGFTGASNRIYWVTIQSGATTFNWGINSFSTPPIGTGVSITGGWQTLDNGTQIKITGAVLSGDRWSFRAFPIPRLGVGTTTPTSPLQVSSTVQASGAIARGVNFNPTLVATANNDVLIGLDINPTFTTGAFTGVTSTALRVNGNILPSANGSFDLGVSATRFRNGWFSGSVVAGTAYFNSIFFGTTNFGIYNSTSTQVAQFFGTGNLTLQNGGTFTDNGYRLDVIGVSRFVGTILSTGSYSVSSGTYDIFNNSTSVVPTSGNMVVNGFAYNSTINQTGGASGITRGVYINPTLTSAADFRAIETTIGNVMLNTVSGNTLIGTTANTGTYKLDVRGATRFSASTGTSLTVISSGNSTSAPVFSVQGSQGELFSVTDSLTGSLFSVSDISGLPILEVFSDSTTIIGDYQAPSLYTTKRVTSITASTGTTIYSFPVSAYTSAFVDYYVTSPTGMRAGNMMAIWSGTTIQSTETSTNDIGNTSPVTFGWQISGSSAVLSASASTGTWTVESILRGL